MLKEIAIADAYGAGFEFSSVDKVKAKYWTYMVTLCKSSLD